MHALVRTAFSRLQILDPDSEERKLADNTYETSESEVKMSVVTAESTIDGDPSSTLTTQSEEEKTELEATQVNEPQADPPAEFVKVPCMFLCPEFSSSFIDI